MTRPFRFGMLSKAGSACGWQRDVARAEADGYSSIVLTDHLDLSGAHISRLSWLPAFADALARTTTLRASVMVANQDLRHPAVLAREVTTLDRLSDGRVELGLGAGHVEYEYAWSGIDFDPAGVRVDRLSEYVAVVRGLTTAGPETFTFDGKHYTVRGMPVAPLPTTGRLPIMVGGGRPRVLSIAARHADIVNLNVIKDDGASDHVLAEKVDWVRSAAGDRMDEIELAMSVPVVAGNLEDVVARDPFAQRLATRMGIDGLAAAATTLVGSTDAIADRLEGWRVRHGISYVVVPAAAADVMAPVVAQLA